MIQYWVQKKQAWERKANAPVGISFKNISYEVQTTEKQGDSSSAFFKPKTSKRLIDDLSGNFRVGEVTAIMGPSGSGKTTLLNIIACRISSKGLTGEKLINGQPYDTQNFGDFANYVMQHDVLCQTMTVRETLEFAAELKLSVSSEEKKKRIESLVKKLKLEKCVDVLVGGALLKGISGGEKKRTSIAFELLSDPAVLILDEPTSGLDSLTSFIIVQYLKELARTEGKTVVMTIHQPNAQIYALFDRLLLLVEGRLIYQGAAKEATDYFSKNFGLSCPKFHNPADFFMSIMHQKNPQNRDRLPLYFQTYTKLIAPTIQNQTQKGSGDKLEQRTVSVSACKAFRTLIWRDYLNAIRNPHLANYRLLSTIIVTAFAAGLYFRFNGDYADPSNWKAVSGFMFNIAVGFLILAMTPVSLVFPTERNVFLKEESAKLYGTFSYFLSRNAVQLPYSLLIPLLQTLIMYWFVGLSSTATQFFITYLVAFGIMFAGDSIGLMLGSIAEDSKAVSNLTPLILNPLVLFSGFFKNLGNLPSWIGWIQYLSPIKYGFQAFLLNQTQFATESPIDDLNFPQGMWSSIGLLMAAGIGFRALSFFFLWRLRSKLQ